MLSPSVENLVAQLTRLPGIGNRTAQRLAFHILQTQKEEALAAVIRFLLLDNLTTRRIEIDVIEFSGIAFRHVDNRVMSLRLVQLGLSNAAMFSAKGEVLQPSEVLYKRPILVERGSFRPVTHVNVDMLRSAHERFLHEPELAEEPVVSLMEITMHNLQAASGPSNGNIIDLRDFLARADMLAACGKTVLISDYFEYYRLAAYLARYTHRVAISSSRLVAADDVDDGQAAKSQTQAPIGVAVQARIIRATMRLAIVHGLQDCFVHCCVRLPDAADAASTEACKRQG